MLLQEEIGNDRTITLLANRRRSPEPTPEPGAGQDLEEVKLHSGASSRTPWSVT